MFLDVHNFKIVYYGTSCPVDEKLVDRSPGEEITSSLCSLVCSDPQLEPHITYLSLVLGTGEF